MKSLTHDLLELLVEVGCDDDALNEGMKARGWVRRCKEEEHNLLRRCYDMLSAWANGVCPEGKPLGEECPRCPSPCNVYSELDSDLGAILNTPTPDNAESVSTL